jgi:hypothetical protein
LGSIFAFTATLSSGLPGFVADLTDFGSGFLATGFAGADLWAAGAALALAALALVAFAAGFASGFLAGLALCFTVFFEVAFVATLIDPSVVSLPYV